MAKVSYRMIGSVWYPYGPMMEPLIQEDRPALTLLTLDILEPRSTPMIASPSLQIDDVSTASPRQLGKIPQLRRKKD